MHDQPDHEGLNPCLKSRNKQELKLQSGYANKDESFIEEVGFCRCVVQEVEVTLVPMAKSSNG